ncbi:unnamed protein product [Parnassius apollo]|uniref:(apollo) hypothetical protein n=1 Tax=Parnassius apollo TaxID=110799 RepID=A0A8S3W789_PARAO|nr:unnamed protein product [Parnassius apollo]
MFALNLKHLYNITEKVIIRNLRNRQKLDVSTGANPGLNKRIKAFTEQGIKIEDEDAEEFVEKSDSDFYNVGEAYNEHLHETLIGKYELRRRIVKEKYFKENMPNLLTWSEKEQIRHLASTDPNEWTPERIAESFPVTAQVVKKLLKYPWKPATEQRIARHDASAMRNWRELEEGSLDIPDDLRKHFLKFCNRTIPPLNKKSIKIDLTDTEKLGEFEQIIQRCSQNDKKADGGNFETTEQSDGTADEAYKTKVTRDTKRMTLDELKKEIDKRLQSGMEVEMPDKILMDTVKNLDSTINTEDKKEEIIHVPEAVEITEYQESDKQSIQAIDYPERIRIPKKVYKKDATYKLNDCYYDHDGRFLYRVLGLSELSQSSK